MMGKENEKLKKHAAAPPAGDRTLTVSKISSVRTRRSSIRRSSLSTKSTPERSRKSSTFKRKDSRLNLLGSSLGESKIGSPVQKRVSCFTTKRGKKVRVVSEAVAINRIQRWCRRMKLVRILKIPGHFQEIVRDQQHRDVALEWVRARLAKGVMKAFFDGISTVSGSTGQKKKAHIRRQRAQSSINLLDEDLNDHARIVQAAMLARHSALEVARRCLIVERAAVRLIEKKWTGTKLYRYLRCLGSDKLAQRIVIQQEIIERRDIIRRYYKDFIQMHQDFYNCALVLNSGRGTRGVPLYTSLILFSSDYSLQEIMDDQKKPFGMGPYHPYSVEEIPEDYKILRMQERRLMFSKEERQLLQEEGILDVNEPPRTPSMNFDPEFVFGSPIDYLRPGELATRIRNNHPSLQLGIRRTSSLILDREFRIIGENGYSEEGRTAKPLPFARSLRRGLTVLHQLMKRSGHVRFSDLDGSFEPFTAKSDALAVDPMDEGEDLRERKHHNDLLLVLKPLSSRLDVSPHSVSLPLVQELLALTRCRPHCSHSPSLLIGMGDPVANAFFHPSVSIGGRGQKDDAGNRGTKGGPGSLKSKPPSVTNSKDGKMDPKNLPRLFKFFSSTRAIGPTWKAFLEENNFSPPKKKTPFADDAMLTMGDTDFQTSILEGLARSENTLFRGTLIGTTVASDAYSQTSNRNYKHIKMTLGDPEKRQEMSLKHFFMASRGAESGWGTAEISQRPESRGISGLGVDFQEVADRAETPQTHFQSTMSVSKHRVVSPFIPDPEKIMYINLQSEFERLAIRENVFRQQLFRRFMLLKESIEKMCEIEAERKREFYRKLLGVEI